MVVEGGVHVPNKVVSLLYSLADSFLYARGLEPGFTIWVVDVGVGAEEREIGAQLVELDGEGVSRHTVESRDVSAAEGCS